MDNNFENLVTMILRHLIGATFIFGLKINDEINAYKQSMTAILLDKSVWPSG